MNDEQLRFLSKVTSSDSKSCWPWTGSKSGGRGKATYGFFRTRYPRSGVLSHRYAFALAKGISVFDIPKGLVVRHLCNNPICCNPDHLALGTQSENMEDMVAAGRSRKGSSAPGAKLSPEKVTNIREMLQSGGLHADIAKVFGVCRETITNIANRKVWAWLP